MHLHSGIMSMTASHFLDKIEENAIDVADLLDHTGVGNGRSLGHSRPNN